MSTVHNRERTSLQQIMLGKLDQNMQKNEGGSLPNTTLKNKLKTRFKKKKKMTGSVVFSNSRKRIIYLWLQVAPT